MRRFIFVLVVLIVGTMGMPAFGSELEELKAVVRQLQQRIEQLENRLKTEPPKAGQTLTAAPAPVATAPSGPVAAAPKAVTEGSLPGSWLIPGTDTSLKIYGNLRVDTTFDIKGRNNDILNNDWSSAVFAQPFDRNGANRPRENQFYATARASRLGFITSTPTPFGPLDVRLEADFNAPNDYMGELASNGSLFRLRHAYGQWGNLLVGQTWSNFIDFRSVPETVDFNPPGNTTLIRQTQVRYTQPLGGSSLALSLENPESLSQLPPSQQLSNSGRNDFDRVPDLIANWTWNGEKAHLAARAVTMEYRNDFHSQRGYGLALGGSAKLGPGTLVTGIQGGEGIGRYMFNSLMQGATETGSDLRLWKAMGWHLGYTYPWTSKLRSNLIFSQTLFGEDSTANAYQRNAWLGKADEFIPNERVNQAFANLFWNVAKNVEIGLEYAYGRRLTFGGEEGTQHRINAMLMVNMP